MPLTFDFGQLRFYTFIVALLINSGLALLLLRYYRQSIPHRLFLAFLITQTLWLILMYTALEVSANFRLVSARIAMFFGTFHAFLLFLFVSALSKHRIPKKLALPLSFFAALVGGLTLSPFVFSRLELNTAGELAPQAGSGIIAFALFAGFCVAGSFFILIRRYLLSHGLEKVRWRYLTIGMILTYSLVMFFDVFYYNATGNLNVIRLNHLYVLPFLLSASYVLLKHHFLNIHALTAELFIFLMIGISAVQVTFANNFTQFIFSSVLFVSLIIFSILLIKNMQKEVRYRVQQKAYEELHKLDAMKSEFIMIASHQLRTPLSIIKGYIATALEGDYGNISKPMGRALNTMFTANERLISLVDSFLNISKMRSGEIELNLQKTDLGDLLDALIQASRPRAEEKGLKIIWNAPSKPMPQLSADQEKIRAVLEGILDNAIRYTKKGSITVRLEVSKGGGLLISVADTGKGLSGEEIKNVFTSFRRGKTAQALWTEGVGLSLYIAKQFVEAHGGRIWVESLGSDKGSTFFVELSLRSHNNSLENLYQRYKKETIRVE